MYVSVSECVCVCSAISFLHAPPHQACEHSQNHLGFHLDQVIRQSVDTGSNLPGYRDSVPTGRQKGRERGHSEVRGWGSRSFRVQRLRVRGYLLGVVELICIAELPSLHQLLFDRFGGDGV